MPGFCLAWKTASAMSTSDGTQVPRTLNVNRHRERVARLYTRLCSSTARTMPLISCSLEH
jgi:hypothetical protein